MRCVDEYCRSAVVMMVVLSPWCDDHLRLLRLYRADPQSFVFVGSSQYPDGWVDRGYAKLWSWVGLRSLAGYYSKPDVAFVIVQGDASPSNGFHCSCGGDE